MPQLYGNKALCATVGNMDHDWPIVCYIDHDLLISTQLPEVDLILHGSFCLQRGLPWWFRSIYSDFAASF